MSEEIISLPIRSALIPVFYQKFRCLAQDCRDSCCVNWSITFSKKDYLRLRRLDAPPALQERLEQGVRRIKSKERTDANYGRFDLWANHNRCPFLDEDGLCAIQRACGHNALPEVCTSFPRRVGYSPAAKEHALSPACEGVLQLLWDMPEGVEFVEDPLPNAEQTTFFFPKVGNLLLYFTPVRGAFIDILQNRAMSLTERMLCLGVMIQRLQKEDWGNFDLDGWERQAALLSGPDTVAKLDIPSNRDMYLTQNLHILDEIALPEADWPDEIYNAVGATRSFALNIGGNVSIYQNSRSKINFSKEAYADALAQFQASFSDYEYFFENLMVATALFLGFPKLDSKEELWKSYVTLCNLYSFYRFVSVLGCKAEAAKERLFHLIVMACRTTVHNPDHLKAFQELVLKHDSSTLAHMAILLRWD